MTAQPRTLLYHLLDTPEFNCVTWPRFRVFWDRMAGEAAEGLGDPRLKRVRVSENTFRRWLAGQVTARGDNRRILEFCFGKSVEQLGRLVPAREFLRPQPLHRRTRSTARQLDYNWPTSRHIPGDADTGIHGTWVLAGGSHWEGTSIGVHLYEAQHADKSAAITAADVPHLRDFARSSRRGMVLASLGAAGGQGLYMLDSALARPALAVGRAPLVPLAHELDDLTYGIVWALHLLDDGLLADDGPLSERAGELSHYIEISATMRNPAPPRSGMPDLSPVGAAWLGSSLCAQYITRHLDALDGTPAYWAREASGEECAPWLLFRHKHAYLEHTAAGPAAGRVFCLPESTVSASPPYERILFFLTAAMMEMHGIRVWVSTQPEHARLEGAVLAADRAILANWLREESVWRVGTTSRRADLDPYREAITHARTRGPLDGRTPAARLKSLASYLRLDWPWLTARCAALAEGGLPAMVRPRSRLLTVTALDRTLRFVGESGTEAHGR
ncbi:transcriptional regulator, XRE family protein [Streptomyces sp. NPDC048290]|uniref:transcriptional regulator, XRE family protein n=1 Tax=Streptomyces sp. NPDC048290 TaxID=3155811 RepID=UPI00341C3204